MKLTLFLLSIVLTQLSFAQEASVIELGEQFTLHSNHLQQDRKINIRLPENYSDSIAYPVIYLLDGSVDEDFLPFCGLAFNAAYPWVNLLPPSIIVGIENVDRRHDFTFSTTIQKDLELYPTTGHSAEFIAFLQTELIPWMDARFKTNKRTIVGQSLGGLVATEMLLKHPEMFDMYILISPSLWWDNQSLLKAVPKAIIDKQQILVCHGDEGELMEKPAKELVELIKPKLKNSKQLFYSRIEGTSHASISVYAFQLAFEQMDWFFGRKK